jgi:hypothetical protein
MSSEQAAARRFAEISRAVFARWGVGTKKREDTMNEPIQTSNIGTLNARELIAFAFVEEAYSRTGDLVAGLLPLFAPVLGKKPGRRFNAAEFASDVQRLFPGRSSSLTVPT